MNTFFEGLIPLFGIVFTFGIPGIIVFWFLFARHRERMRLIDKGLTPEEVKNYFKAEIKEAEKRPRNPFGALKWGILLLFLGIGFVVAKVFEQKFDFDDGITFGVVLLFFGAGFLTYYLIVRGRINSGNGDGTKISNN